MDTIYAHEFSARRLGEKNFYPKQKPLISLSGMHELVFWLVQTSLDNSYISLSNIPLEGRKATKRNSVKYEVCIKFLKMDIIILMISISYN